MRLGERAKARVGSWAAYLRLAAHLTASSLGQGARVCLLAAISKGKATERASGGRKVNKRRSCLLLHALFSVAHLTSVVGILCQFLPAIFTRSIANNSTVRQTGVPSAFFASRNRNATTAIPGQASLCVCVWTPPLSHSPLPNTALHTTQTLAVPAEVASSTARSQDGRGSTR